MAKQLSRKEYIISIVLLIMFACIVTAFLYGVKVGKDSAEKRYAHLVEAVQTVPDELHQYDQQYLASFYHTIYLPYREFYDKWFEHMETIELQESMTNPEALLDELEQLAKETYKEIQEINIPESAVSIHDAHRHYLRSLNLFGQALDNRALKRKRDSSLIAAIESDSFIKKAKHYALEGQKNFYLSIAKWEQNSNSSVELTNIDHEKPLLLDDWRELTFTGKSYVAASILNEQETFRNITPPDVVASVDHLIRSGQAGELGLDTIQAIVKTVVHTNTVRPGDFKEQKKRFYSNENLPQIPLFYE